MQAAYYEGNRTITTGASVPQTPGPGEVRINVAYCGICGTDLHIYLGHMDRRVKMPQIMGHEMSGVIAEVGAGVTGWQVGDRVVVRPLAPCGHCPACEAGHSHICYNLKFLGIDTPGALQGSWTVPAYTLHALPDHLPLDKAALIEPLAVACHDVRLGDVQPGEHIVVIGGGPIGTLVALVAQQAGASVIISEVNTFRVNLAREIGLEAVNPQETDLVALVNERTSGAGADVVFEVSGSAAGAAVMTDLVRTRGRIVIVAIFAQAPPVNLHRFFWRELQLRGARVYEPEDFEKAIDLAARDVLPLKHIISAKEPLANLGAVFEQIATDPKLMKVLIKTEA
ncbi:MAG: alcohol dehydrogenase catalytic domain-containing protein [Anaerolineae bacterium]|nr:alcohol dehydrogenase catalytic domain-containing protein [Anaerolineae bacterium]